MQTSCDMNNSFYLFTDSQLTSIRLVGKETKQITKLSKLAKLHCVTVIIYSYPIVANPDENMSIAVSDSTFCFLVDCTL